MNELDWIDRFVDNLHQPLQQDAPDHIATGSEALNEFAHNAGMDNPDHAWLLHDRDVWVKNPYYNGPPVPHPEDEMMEDYYKSQSDNFFDK